MAPQFDGVDRSQRKRYYFLSNDVFFEFRIEGGFAFEVKVIFVGA